MQTYKILLYINTDQRQTVDLKVIFSIVITFTQCSIVKKEVAIISMSDPGILGGGIVGERSWKGVPFPKKWCPGVTLERNFFIIYILYKNLSTYFSLNYISFVVF